MRGMSTLS